MLPPGVSPEQIEAQIEALRLIAGLSPDPHERIVAFDKIFELRKQQAAQEHVP